MRSVVVDFARERSAERRGGGGERLPLGYRGRGDRASRS